MGYMYPGLSKVDRCRRKSPRTRRSQPATQLDCCNELPTPTVKPPASKHCDKPDVSQTLVVQRLHTCI